ncbi:hypothetical protein [Parapedobacter tibetensis]|uniref:hypothetical protein n=1 Tax=Parapedobacter tibetensis TaxID=2972951 RepID=UPI00214DC1C9|nr:hypothetical protein [Parapedobacter tibetensis]
MESHLPYYGLVNQISQQLANSANILKSIDGHLTDQFAQLLQHWKLLDGRLQRIEKLLSAHNPPRPWLDNADMKLLFNIGDTKLGELKRSAYFNAYDLDGKEVYHRSEVDRAVLGHPKRHPPPSQEKK